MIALIGNRPVLQVGRHQVFEYDTVWLGQALRRAAAAANRHDFPFLDEIRMGVEEYLESRCSLKLLPLPALYDRMRKMLERIGCENIAEKLEPLAPPVTLCLEQAARDAGNGFELAFFEHLREELEHLRGVGAEEVRFTRLKESILLLRGREQWDEECDALLAEVRTFIERHHREDLSRPRRIRVQVEGERFE